jgi:hypothetical protein
VIGEALQRKGVKNFLALEVDPKTLDIVTYDRSNLLLLLDDLYGPRKGKLRDSSAKVVYDTRDLSRLARVLDSQKAATVLHSGKSIDQAEIYVDTREQSVTRLVKVAKTVGVLLKKLVPSARTPEETRLLHAHRDFESAVRAFVGRKP